MDITLDNTRVFAEPASMAVFDRAVIRVLFLFAVIFLSGCSIRTIAVDAMADAIAASGSTYAADDDIKFVGLATPFGLKTTEGLLEEAPNHRGLLLAAARGFTQYAYVYVEQPANEIEEFDINLAYAERTRARRMYLRARDYGLRGLGVAHPDIARMLRRDPDKALTAVSKQDLGLLYWTAASWASAISLGKDDPGLIADLPVIQALIERAYELDESYDQGALHSFLISFEMSRSGLRDGAVGRARNHFKRAIELSEGLQAAPYVALAEAVSIPEQNKSEYQRLLTKALAIDVNEKLESRLANLVMQRRARWLLAKEDHFFVE